MLADISEYKRMVKKKIKAGLLSKRSIHVQCYVKFYHRQLKHPRVSHKKVRKNVWVFFVGLQNNLSRCYIFECMGTEQCPGRKILPFFVSFFLLEYIFLGGTTIKGLIWIHWPFFEGTFHIF